MSGKKDHNYLPPGFDDAHCALGWGCAFKGAGHDRLVSRRWLEYGPWLLLRGPGDLSMVVFHDLDAGPEEALEQARPGHNRMGITRAGGFIQKRFVFRYEWSGFYEPDNRLYQVVVPPDETLEPRKLLEASAIKLWDYFGEDKPVERFKFTFMDEADARAHLHELWLRGLECWAVVDGQEVRLDDDYDPPPPDRPAWVQRLADDLDGQGDWVIGDMSAYR